MFPLNLATIIEPHEPSRTALIDDQDLITYGDLQEWSAAIRLTLDGIGIQLDDRVAVVSGNEPLFIPCLLYTSPSPRDGLLSRMPSSA